MHSRHFEPLRFGFEDPDDDGEIFPAGEYLLGGDRDAGDGSRVSRERVHHGAGHDVPELRLARPRSHQHHVLAGGRRLRQPHAARYAHACGHTHKAANGEIFAIRERVGVHYS